MGRAKYVRCKTFHFHAIMTILCTFLFLSTLLTFCPLCVWSTPPDVSSVPSIAKYFTTKGRYEEVNPHLIEDILAVNTSMIRPPSPQCRPVHLTAIIRHGTRYPTSKNVLKMHQFYEVVKRSTVDKDWLRELRQDWVMWYTEDMDGRLVRKGMDDHRHLAVRLSKLFPSLISEDNLRRKGGIQFMTSSKHRCINSTLSFKRGLTELWDIRDQSFEHSVNDALMRFFEKCKKFVDDVEKNDEALSERDEFNKGPEMTRVQEKIADRLGVPYSQVTDESAEAAFYLCAYEFAIKTVNSPWCQLFDEVDAQVMEYSNDLKQFWKRGYGHDINSKSSCSLFHDLFSRLEKAATESANHGNVSEPVMIQVGHAETLLPLLTLLGFFKDAETLTSKNFASQTKRSFRTSQMLPYAANLVMVLYDCGGGELRLQPLLNEKTIAFPGLREQQSTMPLYADVRERYQTLLQGCDYEAECENFKRKESR